MTVGDGTTVTGQIVVLMAMISVIMVVDLASAGQLVTVDAQDVTVMKFVENTVDVMKDASSEVLDAGG